MDPATTRPAAPPAASAPAAATEAAPAVVPTPLLIADLLERLLGRAPRQKELDAWVERIGRTRNAENFLRVLLQWKPVKDARPAKAAHPAGSPLSPLVDPAAVASYVEENRAAARRAVAGVPLAAALMGETFAALRDTLATTPFAPATGGAASSETGAAPTHRTNPAGPFGLADAAVLRAFIGARAPKRIVEIGTVATATVLDTLDEFGRAAALTLVEPVPGRAGLAEADAGRVEVIAMPLAAVPLARFAALEAGDMLLVTAANVLKTGSDLHHLLFYVLPVLAPGVLVAVANCRFPFEYTNAQIFEKNQSWNGAYAIRALLMYSARFAPLFSLSFFAAQRGEAVAETFAPLAKNPGNTLWIEVRDDGAAHGLAAVGGLAGFAQRAAAVEAGGVTLTPLPQRRPGAPPLVRADVAAEGKVIAFEVADGAAGAPFFALGVRKSGSTMFHKILVALARANGINDVNVPGTFFRNGLSVPAWARQDLSAMLRPGNIFTGFRTFPARLAGTPQYAAGKKVFMHRDPRDAIVSQYFSDAYSHDLPDEGSAGGREKFLEKRSQALATDIDAWVLEQAPSLAKTLEAFEPVLSDPACRVFPYHAYVFEKPALIEGVLEHFGWRASPAEIAAILAEVDVRPQGEDPQRFVRKATPGDHAAKLKPATIAALDAVFARAFALFGYG